MRVAILVLAACAGRQPSEAERPTAATPRTTEAPPHTTDAIMKPPTSTPPDDLPEPDPPPVTLAVLHALPGIDIVESVTQARHLHGGPPARVGAVEINLEVRDQRAHDVAVQHVELLHGHCLATDWPQRTPLPVVGHELYTWTDADRIAGGTTGVQLPAAAPRRYQVWVLFAPVEVYQACDRFAFAIEATIDRAPIALELPLKVTRFEPLRPSKP